MRTARASSDAAQEGHSSNTQNHDSGRSWASTCQAAVTDPRDESGLWVAVQEQHLSPALLHYGSCSSSQCIWLFLLPRLPWRKVLLELHIPRLKRLLYLEHSRSDLNRTSNSQVSLAPSSRPSPRSRGNAVAPTGQATSFPLGSGAHGHGRSKTVAPQDTQKAGFAPHRLSDQQGSEREARREQQLYELQGRFLSGGKGRASHRMETLHSTKAAPALGGTRD